MIRWFAAHPVAANLLMLAFIVVGLFALPSLKRETFPDIKPDEVQITAAYPGAAAEDVEDAVCQRIEDAVEGVEGLDEVRCEARESTAQAVAKMLEGNDIERFLDDVKSEVEAIDSFPADVERPIVKQLGRVDFVAAIAVSGPMAPSDLKRYAEILKDRLMQLPRISQVSIKGFSEREILIEVDADALRRHGLSITDVAETVGRQSLNLPGGVMETDAADVLVRFDDERVTPQQFRDLVILSGERGGEVRLSDIATVSDTFAAEEAKVIVDGSRAALLSVSKTKDQDSLDVMADIVAFLDQERARAPEGVTLFVAQDISSIVEDRLTMLVDNGVVGLVLVFLTLWLFFSLRYSFWVSMGLPVSFFGTFALMTLFGLSIDMISMVGLLIAIGLLMDDAIVIAENVAAHMARGASAFEAAVEGTRQVAPGIVSSFLTTICVFGALVFMQGNIGQVMRVMPIVLIMTLAVSLIEAFLILPHHLAHSLGAMQRKDPSRFRAGFERRFDHFRDAVFGPLVDRAIRWRYLTLGIMAGLLILSVSAFAGGLIKFRAFPDLEGDVVVSRILLPQGTPLARTEAVAARIVAAAERVEERFPGQPDNQPLIRHVTVEYNTNTDAYETGPHVATVTLDLLNSQVRTARMTDIIEAWREETGTISDVVALKFVERQIGPGGRAIDIRLRGDDLDQLKAASLELRDWLAGYEGMLDLSDDLRPGKPEMRLTLKDGAGSLGVTGQSIAAQLRGAFQGTEVTEVQDAGETWQVRVRLAPEDRDSLADLDYFTVALPDGTQVPLTAVADITVDRGFARIHRVDGLRTVTLQGEIDGTVANAQEILADTRERFLPELQARYPGVVAEFEGQARETATTGESVRRNLIIGLIGVYMLLAFQFRSYLEPVIVMAVIPMALVGAVIGHLAQGLEMSMPSMIGLAALSGVVVNDTILLVMFIKEHRAQGMATEEAARQAARARFRAILLTSLTTVAGLMPLLLETSLQAQVLIPLATSLAFGLAAATVLALFLVPALYTVIDDLRPRPRGAAGPAPDAVPEPEPGRDPARAAE